MIVRIILLIAFLFVAFTVVHRLKQTPPAQRRRLYWQYGIAIAALLLVLLAVTGRIHWLGALFGALLPVARNALPWLLRLFPVFNHLRKTRQQSPPQGGQQSQVRTEVLAMSMDHDSRKLSGEVISGPYKGSQLDDMALAQLEQLLEYCHQQDKEGARLLLTYLNHRFGDRWQQQGQGQQQTAQQHGDMDREAALAVLGLGPNPSREEVIKAHRRMMQKMHPDRGGSDYLAAQINQAKDLLLDQLS